MTAEQVRARALLSFGLSHRASLERAGGATQRDELVAWLQRVGAWDHALPHDREILLAPVEGIPGEPLDDARWSDEHAALMAWALSLGPPPPEWSRVDATRVRHALGFLGTPASGVLRAPEELLTAFTRYASVTWARRAVEVGSSTAERVLRATLDEELASVGAILSEPELAAVLEELRVLDEAERARVGAIAFVRKFAAQWLVGGREQFWEEVEPERDSDEGDGDDSRLR